MIKLYLVLSFEINVLWKKQPYYFQWTAIHICLTLKCTVSWGIFVCTLIRWDCGQAWKVSSTEIILHSWESWWYGHLLGDFSSHTKSTSEIYLIPQYYGTHVVLWLQFFTLVQRWVVFEAYVTKWHTNKSRFD